MVKGRRQSRTFSNRQFGICQPPPANAHGPRRRASFAICPSPSTPTGPVGQLLTQLSPKKKGVYFFGGSPGPPFSPLWATIQFPLNLRNQPVKSPACPATHAQWHRCHASHCAPDQSFGAVSGPAGSRWLAQPNMHKSRYVTGPLKCGTVRRPHHLTCTAPAFHSCQPMGTGPWHMGFLHHHDAPACKVERHVLAY